MRTSAVMQDLKHGSGSSPPVNNPLERGMFFTHGWLSERVDLARVALDELLRRDRLGKLAPAYRHEIDDMALATQIAPFTAPVRYYLSLQLNDRLIQGKLTKGEEATFYRRAIVLSLAARLHIIQGDDVPVSLRYQTALPVGAWEIVTTCTSVQVDGQEVGPLWGGLPEPASRGPFFRQWLSGGWDLRDGRRIACTTLGRHRLDVAILVEFHPQGRDRSVIYSETRMVSTTFESTRSSVDQMIKLVNNPQLAAALKNCIRVEELRYQVWDAKSVFGIFEVRPAPVNFAFDVFARFGGRDWPIGHIARAANAPLENLRIDSDYKNFPMPQPPPTVDIVLRSNPKVALGTLDLYSIWNGELVLKNIGFKNRSEP
jgi:hypothetical protein